MLISVALAIAAVLALPDASSAQVKVIVSGGFAAAYREVLPDFERTTGITVTTTTGASQGAGPDTIAAQLGRGIAADVVILSIEGLRDLIADGKILSGTAVDLAQTPIGMAVRAGTAKPDISSIDAFTETLRRASSIAVPGSTTGIYLTTKVFPGLGLSDKIVVSVTARGAESVAMVARGEAALAMQPVSEILNVPGVDFVGVIPAEVQYVSVFTAATVASSKQPEASRRLIAFLSSDRAVAAITKAGMTPSRRQ